jgi:hypothetical protein
MSSEHGGIAISEGWSDLLRKLCEDLSEVAVPEFKFVQIKEKFGQLRIYADGNNEGTHRLIDKAEHNLASVYENCGSTEEVTLEGSWIKVLCVNCR